MCRIEHLEIFDEFEEWNIMQVCSVKFERLYQSFACSIAADVSIMKFPVSISLQTVISLVLSNHNLF